MTTLTAWRRLIWDSSGADTLAITGVRKVCADQSFQLTWWELLEIRDLNYEDLCYTKAKGAQLNRNYWDQSGVDAAVEKLNGRRDKPHSSVSIQLQNGPKDSRSQGFCMQNLVISVTPETCTVDIYYRSTELIQKFLADLVFFSRKLPELFGRLGYRPTVVRFKFANTYLSAVFMPIFLRFEPDPLGFFQNLERRDPKFFRTCGLATRRFFTPTHNYSYRTRVKMFEYYKQHVEDPRMKPLVKMLSTLKGETPTDDEDEE